MIKYGAIRDLAFFSWLESEDAEASRARRPTRSRMRSRKAAGSRREIVAADERESGERALLNFGHTFGHAIETGIGYGEWLHGEAVAAGMVIAAKLSARLGWIEDDDVARLARCSSAPGCRSMRRGWSSRAGSTLIGRDKKVDRGQLRLVLLRALGRAVITADFDQRVLEAVLASARPAVAAGLVSFESTCGNAAKQKGRPQAPLSPTQLNVSYGQASVA